MGCFSYDSVLKDLPLKALTQSVSWVCKHVDTSRLIQHSDHGVQYTSSVYQDVLSVYGITASTGSVGDSYDNALAESVNGAYKAELIRQCKPFMDVRELEQATMRWISWRNTKRLHVGLGYKTPVQVDMSITRANPPVN